MSDWRPIETAPDAAQDGSWQSRHCILVFSPDIGVQVATAIWVMGGVFVTVPGYHGNAVEYWGVTHWAPLPAPPKKGTGENPGKPAQAIDNA